MTPQEFKAWFAGFTEGLDGAPNERQWKRIKAKVSDIDGKPVSYPVYIDRYLHPYWPRYRDLVYAVGGSTAPAGLAISSDGTSHARAVNISEGTAHRQVQPDAYDSMKALYAVGRIEAEEVAA